MDPKNLGWLLALVAYLVAGISIILAMTPRGFVLQLEASRLRALRFARVFCAVAVILLSLAALIGWSFGIDFLFRIHRELASMTVNTAIGFGLAAAALLFPRPRIRLLLAGTLFLLAAATLAEDLTGLDIGLDTFFYQFLNSGPPLAADHRMSQMTAMGLLLAAGAIGTLAVSSTPRFRLVSQMLTVPIATIGFAAILGYAFDIEGLYAIPGFSTVSVNTAIAFLFLSAGLFAAHPQGYAGLLVSDRLGGQLARRLLPFALLLPFIFGWLRIVGENHGLYSYAIGVSLFCLATTAGLVSVIWVTTLWLDHTDARRQEAYRLMQQSEQRYRALFEHGLNAIFSLDERGKFLAVNPAATRLSGYTVEELRSMAYLDLCAPDAHGDARHAFESAFCRKCISTEISIIAKGGQSIELYIAGAPVIDGGKVISVSCIARDVTQQKHAAAALREAKDAAEAADRAKSELLANMSHEIRTPIHALIGMLNLLLDDASGSEAGGHRDSLIMARDSAASLLSTFNAILVMSHMESGVMQNEHTLFSLSDCIEIAVDSLREKATKKGLQFPTRIADDVPKILFGDSRHLATLLNCIVDNAIKFTERGRVGIDVTTAGPAPGGQVRLRFVVRDTGIGIPAGKEILEPFVQADSSATRAQGGLGLGLAIASRLTTLLEGQLRLERAEPEGTIVTVELPFRSADGPVPTPSI